MSKELISVIVPCYNEEEMLPIFYEEIDRISKLMDFVTFEFIFVNDGSKDKTLNKLKELSSNDVRVHYFSFSRNFGKEAALYAGLEHSKGDYVAVMDVDLQDPPELLPEMYRLIQDEEYDCIGTRRKDREGEPIIRSFFARKFYKLINRISDTEIVDGARDFRLMKRQMVNAILDLSEYNRFSKGIFSWVGFETKYLEFQNKERVAGQTTWSFWSLFRYSLDGIVAFSEIPLAMASIIGFFYIRCRHHFSSLFRGAYFNIRQPNIRVDIDDSHNLRVRRNSASQFRGHRELLRKNFSGDKETANLYLEGI